MALEYTEGYKYTSKIGDKEIKFRSWTAKDERTYLKLLENLEKKGDEDEGLTDKMIYDTLILPCIEDKKIVLSTPEQKMLLIDIRIKSISEYLEDDYECPECNDITHIKVKIADIMKFKKSTYADIDVKDLKFSMGSITNNNDKERLNMKGGIVDYIFKDFLLHIKKIVIKDEVQDKFTLKDLERFIDGLPSKIFDEIFEKYQDMVDDLEIEYDFECPSCGHKEKIDYTVIPNLLWA